MEYEIKLLERDAVEKAENDDAVKKAKEDNDLCLASAFAMLTTDNAVLDRWNVNYFNSATDELSNFLVKLDSVEYIDTSKRVHSTEIKPVDVSAVAVPVTKALSHAKDKAELEFKREASKIFITLHNNAEHKNECWTITFFSKDLFLFKIKIDAVTGKTVSTEVKHMLR